MDIKEPGVAASARLARGPLDGYQVVELGTAVTSPLCCMLLGEMGAEVIKVEQPGIGDDSRQWGSQVGGESLYFAHYNRGKKSLVVNLKTTEGKHILRRLAKDSDVLVENLRPAAIKKLGLDYRSLKALNPRLVYCSISGFGRAASMGNLPAYDVIVQAMSGLMSVTGEPEGEPLRVGVPIVDIVTATFSAYAVAIALLWREKTGKGQEVSVSLLGTALQIVGQWISNYGGTGKVPARSGNKYPLITPYEPFRTKDGWVVVAIGNESQWKKLCLVVGRIDLGDDSRFSSNQERIKPENRRLLAAELTKAFSLRPTDDWARLLWQAGVPAGPVNTVDVNVNNRELFDAGLLLDSTHPKIGRLPMVGVVPRLSRSPGRVKGPAPMLGQHTVEVLKSLGYRPSEINRLIGKGVVEKLGKA